MVVRTDFPAPLPSFPQPVVAPDTDPDEGEQVTVCFAADWLSFVIGSLQQLTLQATWQGDDTAVELAQERAQTLIAMFGAADGGCETGLCVDGILYDADTDTITRTLDGGTTYTDAPQLDPRHSDSFRYPPNTASDPRCQSAANMVRWISDLIDQVVLVVDEAGTAEGLIAIMLPFLVELGPFGVLIDLVLALAFLLFSAGATAISAAFTSTVYDDMLCIFYCGVEDDGTVTATGLGLIKARIDAEIGGLVATVMDGMLFLMGEVGLSNAGATGDAPADCSGCASCDWVYEWDFTTGNLGGWQIYADTTLGAYGGYDGTQLRGQRLPPWELFPWIDTPSGCDITGSSFYGKCFHGTGIGAQLKYFDVTATGIPPSITLNSTAALPNQTTNAWVLMGGLTPTAGIGFQFVCDNNNTGYVYILKMRLQGTGEPPPGGVRVDALS